MRILIEHRMALENAASNSAHPPKKHRKTLTLGLRHVDYLDKLRIKFGGISRSDMARRIIDDAMEEQQPHSTAA